MYPIVNSGKKMFLKNSVFLIVLYLIAHCSGSKFDGDFNKLIDSEQRCDTICVESGGIAEYRAENKICECVMDKNIDDVELEALLKNARAMELQLLILQPSSPKITKRQINANSRRRTGLSTRRPGLNGRSTTRMSAFSRGTTRRPGFSMGMPRRATLRTTTRRSVTRAGNNRNQNQRMREFQNHIADLRSRFRSPPNLQMRSGFSNDEQHKKITDQLKESRAQLRSKFQTPSKAKQAVTGKEEVSKPSNSENIVGSVQKNEKEVVAQSTQKAPTQKQEKTVEVKREEKQEIVKEEVKVSSTTTTVAPKPQEYVVSEPKSLPEVEPTKTEQKSSLKGNKIIEQLKERHSENIVKIQNRVQSTTAKPPLVGAANSLNKNKETVLKQIRDKQKEAAGKIKSKIESVKMRNSASGDGKKERSEVITQDPKLYDKND